MKTVFAFLIAVALVLMCATAASAAWYPGTVHAHSTFSDGHRTVEMIAERAAKDGLSFVVITDHYDNIPIKDKYGKAIIEDVGFDNYIRRCAIDYSYLTKQPLFIIAGTEITSYWDGASSHTLAFPLRGEINKISNLQCKEGTQQAIIDEIKQQNMISIAAHPYLLTAKNFNVWRGQISNFQYDVSNAEGINGIEFWNDEDNKSRQLTLSWYLLQASLGKNIFTTAGCDSHGWADPGDGDRWGRKTWVWVDGELTKEKILDAFRQGHTYASQYGAYLKQGPLPGFDYQSVERPKFPLTIGFGKKTGSDKTVRLWRGSELVQEIQRAKGREEYSLELEDSNAPAGKYNYVIEVEDCLITSPIKFNVTPQQILPTTIEPTPSPIHPKDASISPGGHKYPVIEKPQVYPILLGKTVNELKTVMGEPDTIVNLPGHFNDIAGGCGSFWGYGGVYFDYHNLYGITVYFSAYEDSILKGEYKKIRWGSWQKQYGEINVRPEQIVPADILAQEPVAIHRMFNEKNQIVIVWHINKYLYAMRVGDTRRLLFDEIKTINRNGLPISLYRLNQNGRDFRHCDKIMAFVYIDHIPEIFCRNAIGSEGNMKRIVGAIIDIGGCYEFDQ